MLVFTCRSVASYRSTVRLPKSPFPVHLSPTARRERDTRYLQQSNHPANPSSFNHPANPSSSNTFRLLDGPPYANGDVHVGHALNKILKDVTLRYRVLRGSNVRYRPGWDCHGLPIELKILESADPHTKILDPMLLREKARSFAEGHVQKHIESFKSWAVQADWSNPYRTMDREYELRQLQVFSKMQERDLVYHDYKPVYWSPSSQSTLAGAELEYREHRSPSVYVRFPIAAHRFLLIWTTTPWTLPLNNAIAFNPKHRYAWVKFDNETDQYLLCIDLLDSVSRHLNRNITVCSTVEDSCASLESLSYRNPLQPSKTLPVLPSSHVTSQTGTGLVHCAYAHGLDDYQLGRAQGAKIKCLVDEHARYTSDIEPATLAGQHVLSEGNSSVLKLLGSHALSCSEIEHSYPYDWRTHQPVIIRPSQQWFVRTAALKERALLSLDHVHCYPPSARHALVSHLEKSPDWCISRQRAWGVPLPTLLVNGTPFASSSFTNHVIDLIKQHGADCWWTLSDDDLFPADLQSTSDVRRGSDIFDIWFDSGVAWYASGEDRSTRQADVVIEGKDQYRGWFTSLLLTAAACGEESPFGSLVVHGFAVDQTGRKMSKSEGNIVRPADVVSAVGVDGLRLWAVLFGSLHDQVLIGPKILQGVAERLKRIRQTLRYVLSYTTEMKIESVELSTADAWVLHKYLNTVASLHQHYESYNFDKVVEDLLFFIENPFAIYVQTAKDTLYCDSETAPRFMASAASLSLIGQSIAVSLSPILPHLALEFSEHSTPTEALDEEQVKSYLEALDTNHGSSIRFFEEFLIPLRASFLAEFGSQPKLGERNIVLRVPESQFHALQSQATTVAHMLGIGRVSLELCSGNDDTISFHLAERLSDACKRCRLFFDESNERSGLCQRCAEIVNEHN